MTSGPSAQDDAELSTESDQVRQRVSDKGRRRSLGDPERRGGSTQRSARKRGAPSAVRKNRREHTSPMKEGIGGNDGVQEKEGVEKTVPCPDTTPHSGTPQVNRRCTSPPTSKHTHPDSQTGNPSSTRAPRRLSTPSSSPARPRRSKKVVDCSDHSERSSSDEHVPSPVHSEPGDLSDGDSMEEDPEPLDAEGDGGDSHDEECDEEDGLAVVSGGGTDDEEEGVGPSSRKYTFVSRKKRKVQKSAMRQRWEGHLDSVSDEGVRRIRCCRSRKCFKKVNVPFLRQKMQHVLSLDKEGRRRTLHEMMGSSGNFIFDGKRVCANFMVKAFRFSRDLQASIRGSSASVRRSASSRSDADQTGTEHGTKVKDAVITFLERVAENSGDFMPDKDEVHLPFFKKTDVFAHFSEEYTKLYNSDPPSFNYFTEIWRKYCSKYKVRKVSRFSKCSRCEQLRAAIEEAITKGADTADFKRQKLAHREFIQRERREYKKKRENSILLPDNFCSIIVDGADQSAFGLPHFIVKTKEARGHALKVKLVGLLEHGKPNTAYLFTLTEEQETGANHVIEAVHRFLELRAKRGPLPRVLYVQVDNCSRENKNKFFLSYIEYLVGRGVFQSAEVSFLPVGHTHEDVDQLFSRTSERLRSHNAITLSEMHAQLELVYNDKTVVRHMKYIGNWSGLCLKEKVLAKVTHFSQYRYFSFTQEERDEHDHVCATSCKVKVECKGDWRPIRSAHGKNAGFLLKLPDIRNTPPTSITCPPGKDDVTKRIDSEDGRINNMVFLRQLHELRDHVFRARNDAFHWDLEECVELRGASLRHAQEHGDSGSEEEEGVEVDVPLTTADLVRNDYTYNMNSYVAVRTAEGDGALFWIGKVVGHRENEGGVVAELHLHWLQLNAREDSFEGRYNLGFISNAGTKKRNPNKSWVNTDTVLVSFEKLTTKKTLPIRVRNMLRTCGES